MKANAKISGESGVGGIILTIMSTKMTNITRTKLI